MVNRKEFEVRFLRYVALCVMFTIFMILSACSANNAEDLFKTAAFEELQNNQEHAVELYQEIIKKYPENEFSQKAKDRLTELNK